MRTRKTPRPATFAGAVLLAAGALYAAPAPAAATANESNAGEQAASASAGGAPLGAIRLLVGREFDSRYRVELQVGSLDPRLRLAPCARVEPFLPPGTRLWGRTWIGVRCVEGATWSVRLPVTVNVYGNALVAVTPLAAGTRVSASDFRVEEVDLTRQSAQVAADPAEVAGKELVRPLMAGQPLRADALRIPPVVKAGEAVKIVLQGPGLTISASGTAMTAAAEGAQLRVRTDSGKVVAGTVHGHTVEIRL